MGTSAVVLGMGRLRILNGRPSLREPMFPHSGLALPRNAWWSLMAATFAASLLLLSKETPAAAAVLGSLAPAAARPGDWVVLSTISGGGPANLYEPLARSGPLPIFLQRADNNSSGNVCEIGIGALEWAGATGSLRFEVPELPPGSYWVLASVQGQCWRFGNGKGVLVLSILPNATVAGGSTAAGGSASTLVAAAAASLLLLAGVCGSVISRRRDSTKT